MTKDQMDNHFGRHLRSLRDEKGYSLEDISSETRISRQVLQNIEEEAHDRGESEPLAQVDQDRSDREDRDHLAQERQFACRRREGHGRDQGSCRFQKCRLG